MAQDLAAIARNHPDLELLLEPMLSVCCFRFVSSRVSDLDQLNQRLHRQLIHENVHMPSTTKVGGKLAIRPCFVGAQADRGQVEGLVESVLRIGHSLLNSENSIPG